MHPHTRHQHIVSKYLMNLLTILPVAGFLTVIWLVASNTPQGDDIVDAILLVCRYTNSENWSERLAAIFWQYQQHNQVFMRLTYLAGYLATGEVNLHLLLFVGSLFNCGTLYLFAKNLRRHQFPDYCLPVTALLLFSFCYYDVPFWAACVVGYSGTLLLACLCLYLLDLQKPRIVWALACYWLASYTMVSGTLLFPIGTLIILYRHFSGGYRHSRTELATWFVGGTACIVARILTINIFSWDLYGGKPLDVDIWHFQRNMTAFLASLGGAPFEVKTFRMEKIVLGSIILLSYACLIYKRKLFTSPFILGVALFCSGFLLLVSTFRESDVNGYKLYTATHLAAFFSLMAKPITGRKYIAPLLLIMAITFNLGVLHGRLPTIIERQIERDQRFMSELPILETVRNDKWEKGILLEAMSRDIYRPLQHNHHIAQAKTITRIPSCDYKNATTTQTLQTATSPRSYIIALHAETGPAVPAQIQLCGPQNYRIDISAPFDALAAFRPSSTQWLMLDKRDFAPGRYDVAWSNGAQTVVQHDAMEIAPADRSGFYADYCKKAQKAPKAFNAVPAYFCNNIAKDETTKTTSYNGGTGNP